MRSFERLGHLVIEVSHTVAAITFCGVQRLIRDTYEVFLAEGVDWIV